MAFNKANYLLLINALPEGVKLLAATKYATVSDMNEAIDAGVHMVGENKVQDAKTKFGLIKNISKHFIGHLQSNKVKDAVGLFDVIESVDSLKIAEKIDYEALKLKKCMPIMIEVNIAQDHSKFGVTENYLPKFILELSKFKNIKLIGLMTIVPFHENIEDTRIHFKKMKDVFDSMRKKYKDLHYLSMGMSHDYKIAIEEGANLIRIGSYLFK